MRRGVLVGAAVAVLLLGGTAALVLRHSGTTPGIEAKPQVAAVSQGGPVSGPADPAKPDPVPQPRTAVPPSFDVVKVGPDGTAAIAGRAEPGSKVIVRDGDKASAWRLKDNKLEKATLALGDRDPRSGDYAVKTGLAEGDKVIRYPTAMLKDGQVVQAAGCFVPGVHSPVARADDEQLAAGGEGEHLDQGGKLHFPLRRLGVGAPVPPADASVHAAAGEGRAIVTQGERQVAVDPRVPDRRAEEFAGGDFPGAQVTVRASGQEGVAVGGEGGRPDVVLQEVVQQRRADGLAGGVGPAGPEQPLSRWESHPNRRWKPKRKASRKAPPR